MVFRLEEPIWSAKHKESQIQVKMSSRSSAIRYTQDFLQRFALSSLQELTWPRR
jgi:hypothetical protein